MSEKEHIGLIKTIKTWYGEPFPSEWKTRIISWILIFFCGCIFGWIYEEIFYYFADGMNFVNRGVFHGPWLPIYGLGALLMIAIIERFRSRPVVVFFGSGIVCGLFEFIVGYALYHFVGGLRLWNYNTEPWNWCNVDGYFCLRSVLFFAVSGLILVYIVSPICRHFSISGGRKAVIVTAVLVVLFAVDVVITCVFGSSAPIE